MILSLHFSAGNILRIYEQGRCSGVFVVVVELECVFLYNQEAYVSKRYNKGFKTTSVALIFLLLTFIKYLPLI